MTTKKYGRSKALRSAGAHAKSLKQIENPRAFHGAKSSRSRATKMPTEIPADRCAARSRIRRDHASRRCVEAYPYLVVVKRGAAIGHNRVGPGQGVDAAAVGIGVVRPDR